MAGVDPYAPCPCGSGQKFKWCCHKVEAVADRSQRLYESGQVEAALEALDEGLAKEPGNAWLLTRRALILARLGRGDDAKAALREVVARQPKHLGARMLLTRLVLETEGPAEGAAEFQAVLNQVPDAERAALAPMARVVGMIMAEANFAQAAGKHLELALSLGPDPENAAEQALRSIERSTGLSPWTKAELELAPAPESSGGDARGRFDQALDHAASGRWSAAAAGFETLEGDPAVGPTAARNAGLCRLWLADEAAAVAGLRRYIRALGESDEAVDLEALCQQVAPARPDDEVERVQLIWPLRDRNLLLGNLRALGDVHEEGTGPIDADDPESPEVEQFALLDRPALSVEPGGPEPRPEDIPIIEARVLVGREIAALETYDDGRLDRLSHRLTALAGAAIPPAHPRTKVLGKADRSVLNLMWEWLLPEGLERPVADRLSRAQRARILKDIWPRTPNPALGGRTPEQAAGDPAARVPLRAALMILDYNPHAETQLPELAEVRERLGVPPEPVPDPATVDVERLHPARLALVPADRLPDDALVALYRRARRYMLTQALERAARAMLDRPSTWNREDVVPLGLFTDLAGLAAGRGETAEALEILRRGRQADPPAVRDLHAPIWDMYEVRIRARVEPPESWVPELAVVLDRYAEDAQANRTILLNLVELGLVEVVPHPERPGDVLLDSRALQAVLSRYGPKVTTASGRLGVSAAKPEIWTPGGPAGGGQGGGLWTPGAGPPAGPGPGGPGGDKPKLIIPGR